jgi:hypothetical protein
MYKSFLSLTLEVGSPDPFESEKNESKRINNDERRKIAQKRHVCDGSDLPPARFPDLKGSFLGSP